MPCLTFRPLAHGSQHRVHSETLRSPGNGGGKELGLSWEEAEPGRAVVQEAGVGDSAPELLGRHPTSGRARERPPVIRSLGNPGRRIRSARSAWGA